MTTAWFIVITIFTIISPIITLAANERIVIRPSVSTNLCVRSDKSTVRLSLCGNARKGLGQVFDVSSANNGLQIKIASIRKKKFVQSKCLSSSFNENKRIGSKVLTTTCKSKSNSQLFKFRRVQGGVQWISKNTGKCITAENIQGAILVLADCNRGDVRQLWKLFNVKMNDDQTIIIQNLSEPKTIIVDVNKDEVDTTTINSNTDDANVDINTE